MRTDFRVATEVPVCHKRGIGWVKAGHRRSASFAIQSATPLANDAIDRARINCREMTRRFQYS